MYKLDKTKVIKGVVELFPETLKSGIGFFGCGAATGLCCIVANMPINPNSMIETTDATTAVGMGIFFACTSVVEAVRTYKNAQKERERIHALAREIEKDELKRIKEKEELKRARDEYNAELIFGAPSKTLKKEM